MTIDKVIHTTPKRLTDTWSDLAWAHPVLLDTPSNGSRNRDPFTPAAEKKNACVSGNKPRQPLRPVPCEHASDHYRGASRSNRVDLMDKKLRIDLRCSSSSTDSTRCAICNTRCAICIFVLCSLGHVLRQHHNTLRVRTHLLICTKDKWDRTHSFSWQIFAKKKGKVSCARRACTNPSLHQNQHPA